MGDACKATMDNFTAKANEAIKLTGADACLIWESAELAEMSTMLKGCSIKSLESEQTAAKKACTGNFSYCRQEEDKVSKIVSACSASNSADKVAAAVAQGVKNQAAATAVSKKVNETLAASRSASPRTTDITCANFAVEVTSVSTQVTNAPLLASLATMLTTIVAYTAGECSTDDVTSLGTASTTFLESTETITVAIAEKQAALNISTGTTLSVTTVSATTVTTTAGTTGTTTTGTTTTGTTGTTTTGTTTTAEQPPQVQLEPQLLEQRQPLALQQPQLLEPQPLEQRRLLALQPLELQQPQLLEPQLLEQQRPLALQPLQPQQPQLQPPQQPQPQQPHQQPQQLQQQLLLPNSLYARIKGEQSSDIESILQHGTSVTLKAHIVEGCNW